MADFETLDRDQLKEKIDRGDDFVLVETLPETAFKKRHLPDAVNLDDVGRIPELLPDKEAEIVTYCTNFN
ncbi:MAG: rhodanese-like domain-containing protein [Actinomycetota bacterium]|jgi:rhodanese-related sulfurtransferase|nr:rhodanese-like domain-containing protein [Actinomycetota bacterium]